MNTRPKNNHTGRKRTQLHLPASSHPPSQQCSVHLAQKSILPEKRRHHRINNHLPSLSGQERPALTSPHSAKLKPTKHKEENQGLPAAAIQQKPPWFTVNSSTDNPSSFYHWRRSQGPQGCHRPPADFTCFCATGIHVLWHQLSGTHSAPLTSSREPQPPWQPAQASAAVQGQDASLLTVSWPPSHRVCSGLVPPSVHLCVPTQTPSLASAAPSGDHCTCTQPGRLQLPELLQWAPALTAHAPHTPWVCLHQPLPPHSCL